MKILELAYYEGPLEAGETEVFERIGFDIGIMFATIDPSDSGR